jgi:ubiquitin-like domain-containing CTD phosphatase 1
MFTVFTERDGNPWTHSVKALQIIWNHFPQLWAPRSFYLKLHNQFIAYSNATNTIHVDDLVCTSFS